MCIDPGHVAITDMVMPGMSGTQLAAALRERLGRLHVLFISGGAEEAVTEQVSLPDGFEFLTKPFTSDTLLLRIRVLLDR